MDRILDEKGGAHARCVSCVSLTLMEALARLVTTHSAGYIMVFGGMPDGASIAGTMVIVTVSARSDTDSAHTVDLKESGQTVMVVIGRRSETHIHVSLHLRNTAWVLIAVPRPGYIPTPCARKLCGAFRTWLLVTLSVMDGFLPDVRYSPTKAPACQDLSLQGGNSCGVWSC